MVVSFQVHSKRNIPQHFSLGVGENLLECTREQSECVGGGEVESSSVNTCCAPDQTNTSAH